MWLCEVVRLSICRQLMLMAIGDVIAPRKIPPLQWIIYRTLSHTIQLTTIQVKSTTAQSTSANIIGQDGLGQRFREIKYSCITFRGHLPVKKTMAQSTGTNSIGRDKYKIALNLKNWAVHTRAQPMSWSGFQWVLTCPVGKWRFDEFIASCCCYIIYWQLTHIHHSLKCIIISPARYVCGYRYRNERQYMKPTV